MKIRIMAALLGLCCAGLVRGELVSYWPLDEFPNEASTPDVVGGYDMELLSNGAFDASNHVDGKFGKAFEFFGNDDASLFFYTQQDESDKLPINLQPEFTISMWANVVGTGQNDLRLFSESNTQGNNDPLFNIGTANNGADGTLDIYIRNAGVSTGTVNHPHTTAEPFNGEWNHIGWTYADGMHNIYINGIYDSSYPMESFGVAENIDTTTIGGILRATPSHHVTGIIDDVAIWDEVLPSNAIVGLASEATDPLGALEFNQDLRPSFPVQGTLDLAGTVSDIQKGEPQETPGLAQYWFEGNLRGNVEFFLDNGATGAEGNELVAEPFASNTTWWAGGGNNAVISDQMLPSYPDGLIGTRFEGSTNSDNYAVRLVGEIFFEADGEYLIRDGIDDFAMIAIDQDGNGELDDFDSMSSADVGLAPFGDVLVLDDDWANIDGGSQVAEFHGIAEIENISGDGEWRQIEIWMSEGGGGDSGIVYMGSLDDSNIFDDLNGDALSQEERDAFVIRNDRLRSVVSQVESGKSSAELRDDVEYVMQVGADGNSQIVVNDNNGVYETTLDVSNSRIRVEADGAIEEGTVFKLFDADIINGLDSLDLLFDDASQWDTTNLSNGEITFGMTNVASCDDGTMGDIDGSGDVGFSDFLILSANFGNAAPGAGHSLGDIDCSGDVGFSDFLILSANFGQTVGAEASSVPEPSGLSLLGLAALAGGLLRRRK